jgi:hypothetical protein
MAVETPHAPPPRSPLTATTRRGVATAAFCLACWGTLVFWWYPFGLAITGMGLILATVAMLMGVRAGKDGEHLAAYALAIGLAGQSLGWASYRFMMTAFEGQPGWHWLPVKLY